MATKLTPKKAKKSLGPATEKQRKDQSISINQHAFDILKITIEHGYKKTDFAYSEDVFEVRLNYIERLLSKMAWEMNVALQHPGSFILGQK